MHHGVGIFDLAKKSKILTSSDAKKNLMCTEKLVGVSSPFLILYVYDILLIGNDIPLLQLAKSSLKKSFLDEGLGRGCLYTRHKDLPR